MDIEDIPKMLLVFAIVFAILYVLSGAVQYFGLVWLIVDIVIIILLVIFFVWFYSLPVSNIPYTPTSHNIEKEALQKEMHRILANNRYRDNNRNQNVQNVQNVIINNYEDDDDDSYSPPNQPQSIFDPLTGSYHDSDTEFNMLTGKYERRRKRRKG